MCLKECYKAAEGNYEDAVSRLMNDVMVGKFLIKFLDDKSFSTLDESMKSGDYDEAFRAAHTIKGICQNLSLTKLFHSSEVLTEELRHKNYDNAKSAFPQVEEDYRQTFSAIEQYRREAN